VTACFKLARLMDSAMRKHGEQYCSPCVYFSRNLDSNEIPIHKEKGDFCGLGFKPGDTGCREMRTDRCSTRKR